MIKRAKRSKERAASPRVLANRVRYIENQGHPHHKTKKKVLPAANFGCRGQSATDYLKSTHEAHELGEIRIAKQKGGGNPTEDLFFELIIATPEGIVTTDEERKSIDQMILAPFQGCYIRRGWHLAARNLKKPVKKWKQIDDGHYLISARDRFGKATISCRFGHGKPMFDTWANAMDQEICDMLNRSREVKYEPVHVLHRQTKGEKLGIRLTKLYELIAHHTLEPVTRANLADVIEQLQKPSAKGPNKYEQLAKVTNKDLALEYDKLVWVTFDGRQEPRKYRIKTLLLNIAETQLDIELARPDGNEGHEGGAGGESGGGTGGMSGVARDQPESSKPAAPKLATAQPELVTNRAATAQSDSVQPALVKRTPVQLTPALASHNTAQPASVRPATTEPEPATPTTARKKPRRRPNPQPQGPCYPEMS